MSRNPYFTQGTGLERGLYEDLVIEQIKIYGQDVKYVPRALVNEDNLFHEDSMSEFTGAYEVEMYVANIDGFDGDGDLYTKFGIRVTDQVTFIVARKRFEQAVDDDANLIVEGRPNEGDLIYFPLTQKLFEIKYVEYKKPFYQLQNPLGAFVFELNCELFEYSQENFETGDPAIDEVETQFGVIASYTLLPGGTGNFIEGETVSNTNHEASIAYTHADWTQGFTVWDAGDGYDPNDPPSITFSAPPSGGTQATGTVQVNNAGQITGVTLNPGSGYTSAPSFTLEKSPFTVTAEVASWNPATRELKLSRKSGDLTANDVLIGSQSNASWSVSANYSTTSFESEELDMAMNKYFENQGNLILDFSEKNPFGEYGDMGASF